MDRRRLLGLTSAIVAGGCVLGPGGRSWAQVAPAPRPGARPAAGPPEPPTASAPGVSARDVKIGMSAAFNAEVVVEGLRRAGANPTRASLRQAIESLRNLDLGIGAPLTFGAERHQGLDSVYFTRVEGGRWMPITDWTAAVRA
jgi:hypothetical protein